jgi:GNAT superfamily N-acetyltransferase
MPLVLRPATKADQGAVVALDHGVRNASGQPPHTAEWLEPGADEWIASRIAAGECFVAELDGEIAAYAVLHHHFFHDGMIDMLIVAAHWRRQDIARELLRYLAGQCRSEKLWTSTNLSNQPMQALLAGEGFRMSGFIEGLDDGDPELIYHKRVRA